MMHLFSSLKQKITFRNVITLLISCILAIIVRPLFTYIINQIYLPDISLGYEEVLKDFFTLFTMGWFKIILSVILEELDPRINLSMNSSNNAGYSSQVPTNTVSSTQPTSNTGVVNPAPANPAPVNPGIPWVDTAFANAFAGGQDVVLINAAVNNGALIPNTSYQPYATNLARAMETCRSQTNNSQDLDMLPPNERAFARIVLMTVYPNYNTNIHYLNTSTVRTALKQLP